MEHRTPKCDEQSNFHGQDLEDTINSPNLRWANNAFKTTEEIISDLRRENFRLRLMCFDYEKARKRMTNPQDAESSRLFSVEAENLTLKEVLAEKTDLLRSASKTIDALKEENNLLTEKLKEREEKLQENNRAWRRQYDALYRQLQQANDVIQSFEFQSLIHEREDNGLSSDIVSRLSDLSVSPTANKTEADQGQLRTTQTSFDSVKLTDKKSLRRQTSDVFEISHDLHKSCQLRFQEACEVVYALIKQLNDAGLSPAATIRSDLLLSDKSGVADMLEKKSIREPLTDDRVNTSPTNIKVRDFVESDFASGDHVENPAATIKWLSERLNAARHLILDLGNQKLRQDALIAQLQSAQRLSTSGILHSLSVQPTESITLPTTLDFKALHRLALTTPTRDDSKEDIAEPHSLTRLRDLYRLVHDLQLQLENVRFTQHSFVELINRSLCTSGLDVSLLLSPSKRDLAVQGSCDSGAIGVSFSAASDKVQVAALEPNTARHSQPSAANATYGGTNTLADALNESLEPSFSTDYETKLPPASSMNQTVCDLNDLPSSPIGQSARKFYPTTQLNKPLSFDPSAKPTLHPAVLRLRNSQHTGSASFCEGTGRRPIDRRLTSNLNATFTVNDHYSDSEQPVGDVTLVEWQNRELFERLARATAELRDVLVECSEVGSQLFTNELSQSILHCLSIQADEPAAAFEASYLPTESHSEEKTPILATPAIDEGMQHRSVRFDRVDPHLVPADFAELSVSSGFSHLLDPEWRAMEATLSEHADNKISVDTQTCSSRPTTTIATDVSTQTVSEASDVVICHRFVSLILHALTVLHKAVHGATISFGLSPSLSILPGSCPDDDGPTWWASWIQSATHWFQSFLDVINTLDGSKCTDSTARCSADKDEVHSLLECLERVFNERIDGWITEVESGFKHLQHNLDGLHGKNECLSTELLRVTDELKRVEEQKVQLETRLDELETELDDLKCTSAPFDEHQAVLQKLTNLEEQVVQSQRFSEQLECERRQLRALIPDDVVNTHDVNDLIGQVQLVCSELADRRQDVTQLQKRYALISDECNELKQKLAQCLDDFGKQSTMLRQQFESQLLAVREDLHHRVTENKHLMSELELYRTKEEQLTLALKSREMETNRLLDQLNELQNNIQNLQTSLAAEKDNARVAADTAAFHEEHVRTLNLELEHLRNEHAVCSPRPLMLHAQTSPSGLSRSADNVRWVDAEELPQLDKSAECRARKYGELKAVAFEIKEKLIRRTDKLEVALTEIARLRSVIQQDKEHASHVLKEVEDLRKQAIRKNRRIHELEAELARLKKSAASAKSRNSQSPTRRLSEPSADLRTNKAGPDQGQLNTAQLFSEAEKLSSTLKPIDERASRLEETDVFEKICKIHNLCQVSDDPFVKWLISELRAIIALLSQSPRYNSAHSREPSVDDAEPVPSSQPDSQNAGNTSQSAIIRESHLSRRIERYRRRYRQLVQGIDSLAKELSQTADILSATRSSLEQTAGLSVSSDQVAKQDGLSDQA